MAAKKKDEEQISPEDVSKNVLGKLMKDGKDDHFNDATPENLLISTGSMILDEVVKIRAGSTVRMCGEGPELGKTSQCFVFARNYMETVPRSKTIFVCAESRLSPEMQARTGLKFVTDPEEWTYGTVFVLRSNIFEYIAKTIETLLKSMKDLKEQEHLCTIIDSLDGLILKADTLKEYSEGTVVAGVPKLTKLFFRRVGLLNWAGDGLILATSQWSANIKLDPYAKSGPNQGGASNGSSAGHQSDYTFLYTQRYVKDYILEKPELPPDRIKNKTLGLYSTIEILKSATDESKTRVRIPIKKGRIGNQIWTEKEVSDLIIAYELMTKGGSWLTFDEKLRQSAREEGIELIEKVQGQNKLYAYLEENPPVLNWFKKKFERI